MSNDPAAPKKPGPQAKTATPPLAEGNAGVTAAPMATARTNYGVAFAVLAGAAVALLGSIALHLNDDPTSAIAALQTKLMAVTKAAAQQSAATDARLGGLEKQFAALATPKTTSAAKADSIAPGATPAAETAMADISAFAARAAKINTGMGALTDEMTKLKDRLDAMDGKLPGLTNGLANAKSQIATDAARIDKAMATPNAAAVAVVAQSAVQAIDRNEAIGVQVKALQELGLDEAKLAPLLPLAVAPPATPASLASAFKPVMVDISAKTTPAAPAPTGVLGWMSAKATSLVKVHAVGAPIGTSPDAVAARVEAALARGDTASALAAWNTLPEVAKGVSQSWVQPLQTREAARAGAQALLAAAIAGLGSEGKTP